MNRAAQHRRFHLPLSRRGRYALLIAGAALALAAGLFLYDYVRLNLWIESDAGQFENYPVELIRRASDDETPPPPAAPTPIDRALIDVMTESHNVVAMSRSEIKYNLFHTNAYAKVYLETAAPEQPDRTSRLVLVCEFRRNNGDWTLNEAVEKTLE